MKALFALAVLALNVVAQTPSNSGQSSGLQIVEISFTKKFIRERGLSGGMVRNDPPVLDNSTIMIPGGGSSNRTVANKNEKATNASSARRVGSSPNVSVVWDHQRWVYNFQAQIRNNTLKPITRFVWAYTVPPEPVVQEAVTQDYLCRVRIEPGETKRIKVRSPIPRPKTVDASAASKPPAEHQPALSDMSVNQIEFVDGTIWRRSDWNAVVLTRLGARKLAKGKCIAL